MHDNLNFNHLFGQWGDDSLTALDGWFNSSYWKQICSRADAGCETCLALMERVSDMLNSLIYHIQNDSGSSRVQYEINQFTNLLKQFESE